MKATIKNFYSNSFDMIDIDDLTHYLPKKADNFGFLLTVIIGPKNEDGEEALDFFVCTPRWLLEKHSSDKIIFGKDYIIVFEYNFDRILNHIKKLIDSVEEDTWDAIGEKLTCYGIWEFQDYKEYIEH